MSELSQAKSTNVKQDRKRIPLGTRNVLTAPKRPGFARRFVNNKGDRIENFKDAGWNVVNEDIKVGDPKIGKVSPMGSPVSSEVGGGQRALLMEIPEDLFNEDRAASQAKITTVENEIKRNIKQPGQDGLSGDVKIS